jgi:integrase/recombinase XerD
MFEQLFACPRAQARHRTAPMLEERLAYLAHLVDGGRGRKGLRLAARQLLSIVKTLRLARRPDEAIRVREIEQKVPAKDGMRHVAMQWLGLLNRLEQPRAATGPYTAELTAFVDYMNRERGFTPATVRNRCWIVPRFLERLDNADGSLCILTAKQLDEALKKLLCDKSYSRITVQNYVGGVRCFFRFAELRGWCRKGLAESLRSPRVFRHSSLPVGPSWDDVKQLLALTEGNRSADIRDRAILMLLAIYGLRNGEVSQLRLDDFDWERELLIVEGSKTQRARTWPLNRPVGDAVLRYLREVRPRSAHREVFLTLRSPFRPLKCLWPIVAVRLRPLDASLPHHGPHALRHACATRLLERGLALKEIGDHLGHCDPDTTRIYAKVDLNGLREVADLDLGGLL